MTIRDNEIIEFIEDYKVASTDTITELFFPSLSACQKRLKVLVDNKMINRVRDGVGKQYVYYKKRPKYFRHSLLITDFYRELSKRCDVISFIIEPKLDGIQPDATFGFKDSKGKGYLGFLEVEISKKGFDYNKYFRYCQGEKYRSVYPVMPFVYVVGDYIGDRVAECKNDMGFNVIVIKTDFSNMRLM